MDSAVYEKLKQRPEKKKGQVKKKLRVRSGYFVNIGSTICLCLICGTAVGTGWASWWDTRRL